MSYTDNRPIVVVSSTLDSAAFFRDQSLGADSSIAGVAVALAAANALSQVFCLTFHSHSHTLSFSIFYSYFQIISIF